MHIQVVHTSGGCVTVMVVVYFLWFYFCGTDILNANKMATAFYLLHTNTPCVWPLFGVAPKDNSNAKVMEKG